ncbi:MAG: nucleotide exchange factor GrpE [SAR324 cluster bacterium]|nr:nucleotide exchange factor GrpE [SAR324 cluster bacterium]
MRRDDETNIQVEAENGKDSAGNGGAAAQGDTQVTQDDAQPGDVEAAPAPQDAPQSAAEAQTAQDAPPEEDEQTLLANELDEAKQLAQENYDKYLRFQAEFENYKKRTQKEHAEHSKYAQLPLLRDLIGILDNLERAVEHAKKSPEEGVDGILAGVEMVAKQINETIANHGMKRIEAVGGPFDPTRHEAMNVVETDEAPEGQVLQEFQAGYVLYERVVKPSMVTVSKPVQKSGDGESAQQDHQTAESENNEE